MVNEYSKGLEQIKSTWMTPPGTDAEFVRDMLPTPEEVVKHFEHISIIDKSVEEISVEKHGEQIRELWETPLQNTSIIDTKLLTQASGNQELNAQLSSLFKSFNGNYQCAYSNGMLRIAYNIPDGDSINIVFNLNVGNSTNEAGLKIDDFYQTNDKGLTMDMMTILPEAKMYYTKAKWFEYLLRPSLTTTGMGISGDRIVLLSGLFRNKKMQELVSPGEFLSHEAAHRWFEQKYPELTFKSKEYIVSQMGMNAANLAMILLALGISSWYFLPYVAITIGGYLASRSRKNAFGEDYHALLANESHSHYIEAVFSDMMARKGFKRGAMFEKLEDIIPNFLTNYLFGYQPMLWGLIDTLRFVIQKPTEKEIKGLKELYQ